MGVLIIDNNDSFTYNLYHLVKPLVEEPIEVERYGNIESVWFKEFNRIIISPGPGVPNEYPRYFTWLDEWRVSHKVLGICMGHEIIACYFGSRLRSLNQPLHGIRRPLSVSKQGRESLFRGMGKEIQVGLYHSWVIDEQSFPDPLDILAWDDEGHIMALRHRKIPFYSVQFHPESYMTSEGACIISNWMNAGSR